eukprot:gene1999-1198_t
MSVCIVWYYVVCSGQAFAGSLGSIHYLSVFPRGGLFIWVQRGRERERETSLLYTYHYPCSFFSLYLSHEKGNKRKEQCDATSQRKIIIRMIIKRKEVERTKREHAQDNHQYVEEKYPRLKVTSTTKVGANAILDHFPSALCLGSQGLEDDPPTHPITTRQDASGTTFGKMSPPSGAQLDVLFVFSFSFSSRCLWGTSILFSFSGGTFHSTLSNLLPMPPAARSADTSTDALLQQIPSTLGALQEQQHAFQAEVARRLDSMSATVTALERENWACRSSPLQSSHFRREMLSSPICVYLECTSF